MALNRTVRLQKFLAQAGVSSRRSAEALIQQGVVSVDGVVITEMGYKIDPGQQEVRCRGEVIHPYREAFVYILLNKPKGYVTTVSDPQGRPIVTALLHDINERVFPVGRLDIDTEGALLLTNDGALAHRILHPSHQTTKTYEALVQGHPRQEQIDRLKRGIILDGRRTAPAHITLRKRHELATRLQIVIHEGRKRQVRKMFAAIGHPVLDLKRTAYGKLFLGQLKTGHFRHLNENDLKKIFL